MKEEQETWIHRLYFSAASKIIRSTPKLFVWSSDRTAYLVAHGSAVLLKIENDHYLLTAAHCLYQREKMIQVGILDENGHPHMIRGAVTIQRGQTNNIDVAAVKLSDESVQTLSNAYTFVDATRQVMLNDNIKRETEYLIVGHPNTSTRIDNKRKKVRYNPLFHISKSAPPEIYRKLNVSYSQSLMLGYSLRKSNFIEQKEMNMAPDPTGISGSGLWYIPRYDVPVVEDVQFLLSGVLIEHYTKHNLVKATKIEEVIPLIRSLRYKSTNISAAARNTF